MEYNNPSDIVKNLTFGDEGKGKVMLGVQKLCDAVQSTLGASGTCVIYEDAMGKPVITKDGVTVAESVVLLDPIENIGATLIKEAARNTVKECGDGTTTSSVLARYLLEELQKSKVNTREIKKGLTSGLEKVNKALEDMSIKVTDEILNSVASISCNNDLELGKIIGDAFSKVGQDGVVLIEESETNNTYADVVNGVQFDSRLKSPYLVTNKNKNTAELENPYVLICSSPIPNIRKILGIIEHVMKEGRALLIVGELEGQPTKALLTNKVKGNIKVNFVDAPGFGATKKDTIEDLAILTGAKVISEDLGDDLDLITVSDLGEIEKSVTDEKSTVVTLKNVTEDIKERIDSVRGLIKEEDNPYIKKKLEQRLAMLSGKVGVVYVGADSDVELKEKKDRVEDAVYATKAALSGGIVSGGGVALKDASKSLDLSVEGERILYSAINMPMEIILRNAGIESVVIDKKGYGIDVVTGNQVNMIDSNIIDPLLVTKSALKNAVSVASTIISADCIISNIRA